MSTQMAWVTIFGMLFLMCIILSWINNRFNYKKAQLEATRVEEFKTFEAAKCRQPHADGSACIPMKLGNDYLCPYPGQITTSTKIVQN